jgi:hypothetical protein
LILVNRIKLMKANKGGLPRKTTAIHTDEGEQGKKHSSADI